MGPYSGLYLKNSNPKKPETQCKLEPHRYVLKMLGLDVPSDKLEAEQSVSSDDDNYKNQPIKVTQDDFDRIKLISQGACKYSLI